MSILHFLASRKFNFIDVAALMTIVAIDGTKWSGWWLFPIAIVVVITSIQLQAFVEERDF